MTWYQIDCVLFALAVWRGRPPLAISVILGLNLAAGYFITDDAQQIAMAVSDLIAAALIFGRNSRGDVIAALLIFAIFINLSLWLAAFPTDTTYAILDAVSWVQFGVLGGLDRGSGNVYRSLRDRMAASPERAAGLGVAINQKAHRGGLNDG